MFISDYQTIHIGKTAFLGILYRKCKYPNIYQKKKHLIYYIHSMIIDSKFNFSTINMISELSKPKVLEGPLKLEY